MFEKEDKGNQDEKSMHFLLISTFELPNQDKCKLDNVRTVAFDTWYLFCSSRHYK